MQLNKQYLNKPSRGYITCSPVFIATETKREKLNVGVDGPVACVDGWTAFCFRLANKQDKASALLESELIEVLSLERLVNESRTLCHIVSVLESLAPSLLPAYRVIMYFCSDYLLPKYYSKT